MTKDADVNKWQVSYRGEQLSTLVEQV